MGEQFDKVGQSPDMEFGKVLPDSAVVLQPVELSPEDDKKLTGLLAQAKEAEKGGDSQKASDLYNQYQIEYSNLRQTEQEQKELEKARLTAEFLGIDEEKGLNYIQKLLDEGADKNSVAQGLAGLDSDKAWQMRQNLLSQGVDKRDMAQYLAGLDSDKAWQMRQEFLDQGLDKDSVAWSLVGLDSEKAWQVRQEFLDGGIDVDFIVLSLAGLDSDKAWQMRQDLLAKGAGKGYVARGVFGDFLMAGVRAARAREKAEKEKNV